VHPGCAGAGGVIGCQGWWLLTPSSKAGWYLSTGGSLCSRLLDIDVSFPPEGLEIKSWQHDQ
jgi:hypothetical protein